MTNTAARMEVERTYVPPLLEPALETLEKGFLEIHRTPQFQNELNNLLTEFAGRKTPLTYAPRLSEAWNGKVYLKREDLLHSGAHKLNNALGQCLLAKYMGYREVLAETGAGQHGVATAIACARLGLKATVYQGATDVARQQPNAGRMKLFGAKLIPVTDGAATLKEAVNAAMKAWVASYRTTAYCVGSAIGPHPYPSIVRYFQKIIGDEAREQILAVTGKLPDAVLACVGGGSNAAGIYSGFESDSSVQLVACEAYGAASLARGTLGTLHGMESLILQTAERQIEETHSISAGLDYPGVGPWLAGLKIQGRLKAFPIQDEEALASLSDLAQFEGILCALESAHALAGTKRYLEENPGKTVVVCVSGRGDKDLDILLRSLKEKEKP